MTIVVGARTAEAVRGAFELGRRVRDRREGQGRARLAQTLVRALTLMRPRGLRGGARAFVGRATELELLQAIYRHRPNRVSHTSSRCWATPASGRRRWCRSSGAGSPIRPRNQFQRTGRCLAYGHLTYWALGEILREHLGILESESEEEVRRRLGDREILGLALGLDLTGDAHPLAVRDRFQEAWVEFLGELTAAAPTVLLVEDLHWAEDPLLDLLERVCRDVRGPLLVIGTARPELLDRRRSWGGGGRKASLVWLDALSPVEAAEMLDELVPGELSDETRRALVERRRAIRSSSRSSWPPSSRPARSSRSCRTRFRRSSPARVDRLESADKAALQAASVIGRVFWSGPTLELVGGEPVAWTVLEERDFIRRRPTSSIGGRGGVRVQARADARGGLRQRFQGAAREAPRPDRCVARAHGQRA